MKQPTSPSDSPLHPTLNIEGDHLTAFSGKLQTLHTGEDSKLSTEKPFAYPDLNLASVTKKARFRELFTDHFENSRKETKVWKPKVQTRMETEHKRINKFIEQVEFIDVEMATAIRVSYDHDKRMDDNLREYKDIKQL